SHTTYRGPIGQNGHMPDRFRARERERESAGKLPFDQRQRFASTRMSGLVGLSLMWWCVSRSGTTPLSPVRDYSGRYFSRSKHVPDGRNMQVTAFSASWKAGELWV